MQILMLRDRNNGKKLAIISQLSSENPEIKEDEMTRSLNIYCGQFCPLFVLLLYGMLINNT